MSDGQTNATSLKNNLYQDNMVSRSPLCSLLLPEVRIVTGVGWTSTSVEVLRTQ